MSAALTNQRILVLVIVSMTVLGPFTMDMYLPAVPDMARQLSTSTANVQLTVAAFLIGTGAGQLVFGPLSDRLGRRLPALCGITLYIAAAIGCALAVNVESLIALRLLQALGVCAAVVTARAVVADLYEPQEMARLTSLLGMIGGIAPMIAPIIGGFMLVAFSWRAIFITLACYGAIAFASVYFLLPETQSHEARGVSRKEAPHISYWRILKNWRLMRFGFISAFGAATLFTYLTNAPVLFIEQLGIRPQDFGFYFGANAIGLISANQLNRTLLRHYSVERMLLGACIASVSVALVFLTCALNPSWGRWPLIASLFFTVACFPLVMPNSMALAQGEDRLRAGAVAAVLGAVGSVTGFIAAMTSGYLNNGTAVPMASVMVLTSTIALCFFLSRRVFAAPSKVSS